MFCNKIYKKFTDIRSKLLINCFVIGVAYLMICILTVFNEALFFINSKTLFLCVPNFKWNILNARKIIN